jgi:DNA topoisomerase-6 subunit B
MLFFAFLLNIKFALVLSGTKYCVRQNRGRFGLGAKMVLIWSKMSTSQPICILSSTGENEPVSKCVLDINIVQNVPNILVHEKLENQAAWRGSEITVLIEGSWTPYRVRIQ